MKRGVGISTLVCGLFLVAGLAFAQSDDFFVVIAGGKEWKLTGNAGTTPGTHFLGTTDNKALDFRVNNARALRLEPDATSPNVIGGHSDNSVSAGAYGATISGGGQSGYGHIAGYYATVGGGWNNTASGDSATVGGGYDNTASLSYATVGGGTSNTASSWCTVGGGVENTASGIVATVGGGYDNTASSASATVGGGYDNTASGDYATVGGGNSNTASGLRATVPGGYYCSASGNYSFATGRKAIAIHEGSFVWADSTDAYFWSTDVKQFVVRALGGVGLGTNAPLTQLHVLKSVSGGAVPENHVAIIENTSTGSSPDVLALKVNIVDPGTVCNFITFADADGNLGSIEGNGSGSITFNTTGGDFAEYLRKVAGADERLAAGDIVGVFSTGVSLKTDGAQRVLVITTSPVVLGNRPKPIEASLYAPVAFLGRAPVKVRGKVQAGDYIVPSGREDGSGVAVPPEQLSLEHFGRIVGRARECSSEEGLKQVNVLVGLPAHDLWYKVLREREERIAKLETRLTALEGSKTNRMLEAKEERIEELEKRLSRVEAFIARHFKADAMTIAKNEKW